MNDSKILLMSEGNVPKSLFKLGIPMVISMLVTALYNVVDTYFVAALGVEEVAAVSVAFPISYIFSGIGLTFGIGGGSLLSRLLGKKENHLANCTATTSLLTSFGVGIIASVGLLFGLDHVLNFMGATSGTLSLAREYSIIYIISAIFTTVNITAANLAVAQGGSNISLISMIVGAVLNIILDPIFIYLLNWGIAGAAIATLIAQIVSTLIYLYFFLGKKSSIKLNITFFKPSLFLYGEILKIGVSMLFLQLLSTFSMSLIIKSASNHGDKAVAAIGIVLRILMIGSNIVFGYMKGFQPMAGFNYGARNYNRLKDVIKSCFVSTTGFCLVWSIIVFIFAKPIISIFATDTGVLDIAVPALIANTVMFFSFGFQFTYSTLYLSLGKALPGMILNLSRQGIFFIPAIIILPKLMGLNGVIWAQGVADFLTLILTIIMSIPINRRLNLLNKASINRQSKRMVLEKVKVKI